MVKLSSVQSSNDTLKTSKSFTGQVSFFVGATSGLGLATLTEYTQHTTNPKIYIVGRSDAKLTKIISDLQKLNTSATFVPIKSEYELIKNVDAACAELASKESRLDLLVMSPGYLKVNRQPDNEEGIEPTLSLRYYARARFVQNLLPLMTPPLAPHSRIVSIHAGGREGRMDESDLLLQRTYSMMKGAMHTATMNTLALEEVARLHPSVSCLHVFPSIVITPAFDTLSEDWIAPLRLPFRYFILPVFKRFIAVGLGESGERQLFYATSARYPSADSADTGVALPSNVKIADGADGTQGSGCYLLDWDGETVGDKKLLDEYRKNGWGKKVWEHTQQVVDNALAKKL